MNKPLPTPANRSIEPQQPEPATGNERRVVLGRIRAAVGLAGWVKVESFTDPADNLLKYRTWQLRTPTGWRLVQLNNSRWSGRELQVQFVDVAERNAADLLRNTDVAVFRHEMPAPKPGEYYREDLLGLTAFTPQGETLGRLDHYVDSAAHPYMVLLDRSSQVQAKGQVENLVPLTKGRVQSVDFEQGTMVLDWTLDWSDERDE